MSVGGLFVYLFLFGFMGEVTVGLTVVIFLSWTDTLSMNVVAFANLRVK